MVSYRTVSGVLLLIEDYLESVGVVSFGELLRQIN